MPKGLRAEDAVKDAQPPPDWLQNTSCAGSHLLTLRIVSHDGDVTSSVISNEDESCRSKENEPGVSSRTQHASFGVKSTASVAASPRHAAGETEQVQQGERQGGGRGRHAAGRRERGSRRRRRSGRGRG